MISVEGLAGVFVFNAGVEARVWRPAADLEVCPTACGGRVPQGYFVTVKLAYAATLAGAASTLTVM